MKKLLITFILLFLPFSVYAEDESILLDVNSDVYTTEEKAEETYEPAVDIQIQKDDIPDISRPQPITGEHSKFFNVISDTVKDVYKLQIENISVPSSLLKDQLTFKFEKGPVEQLHLWNVIQMNMIENIDQSGGTTSKFEVGLINTILDGKFKGGKENFRIMLDTTPQNTRPFIQNLFQDMYVETKRIPHHKILVGNSRPKVGYEGSNSSYTLPFLNRSQIARHFGTVRKTGIRVMGDYSLVGYDFGGYSSGTYFTSFFPGAEFDGWINLKPLGKTDGRYGKLVLGGGIVSGSRDSNGFFVASTYLGYSYKKFWFQAEYATADGSNGATGFSKKQRHGWCATLGYRINKKLEAVIRYDDFNPDRNISDNNRREYSAGLNYYIKGTALMLILNYVFCQNQADQDSHRILIGTQIAL